MLVQLFDIVVKPYVLKESYDTEKYISFVVNQAIFTSSLNFDKRGLYASHMQVSLRQSSLILGFVKMWHSVCADQASGIVWTVLKCSLLSAGDACRAQNGFSDELSQDIAPNIANNV